MTNRPTFHSHLKIPACPVISHLFRFKEYDSYCNPLDYSRAGGGFYA